MSHILLFFKNAGFAESAAAVSNLAFNAVIGILAAVIVFLAIFGIALVSCRIRQSKRWRLPTSSNGKNYNCCEIFLQLFVSIGGGTVYKHTEDADEEESGQHGVVLSKLEVPTTSVYLLWAEPLK